MSKARIISLRGGRALTALLLALPPNFVDASSTYDGYYTGKLDGCMNIDPFSFRVEDGRFEIGWRAVFSNARIDASGKVSDSGKLRGAGHYSGNSSGPIRFSGRFTDDAGVEGSYNYTVHCGGKMTLRRVVTLDQLASDTAVDTVANEPAATAGAAAVETAAANRNSSDAPTRSHAESVAMVDEFQGLSQAAPPPDAGAVLTVAEQAELSLWEAVRRSGRPDTIDLYLAVYPDGQYAAEARALKRTLAERAVAAAAAGGATAVPDIDFGRYHLLAIGNNDYRNLKDLRSAIDDARAVADLLARRYGFEIRLLINATRHEILGELARYRATLGANDNLLVFYAGHGIIDSKTERGFWLPVDAESDNPANWISTEDVTSMVAAIDAKHVLLVVDSCYSGTLTRAANAALADSNEEWMWRLASKRARTVMTSGGVEPVLDGRGNGHSVFARALLDALGENREVIEGQRLFTRIRRPVALESQQTPEYADIRGAGHQGGDFLFVPVRSP